MRGVSEKLYVYTHGDDVVNHNLRLPRQNNDVSMISKLALFGSIHR